MCPSRRALARTNVGYLTLIFIFIFIAMVSEILSYCDYTSWLPECGRRGWKSVTLATGNTVELRLIDEVLTRKCRWVVFGQRK